MHIRVHDSFGHIRDTIESAGTPHGSAYESRLMRHIHERSKESDEHAALIEALTGRDAVAVRLATEQNDSTGDMIRHDAGVLKLLANTCGGIYAQVAVCLIPWLGDECSIEGDDHSGMAWRDGVLVIDPIDGKGVHYQSDGSVVIHMDFPETVCAAAPGRTLGAVIEQQDAMAGRVIAGMESDDGATTIRLAA